MNIFARVTVFILASVIYNQQVLAQAVFDREDVSVIQKRIFDAKHEISTSLIK